MKTARPAAKICSIIFVCLMILSARAQQFTSSVREFITDSAKTIVLVDVKIIDGTGNPSKSHQTIIIINGRIAQTGKKKTSQYLKMLMWSFAVAKQSFPEW
jgi:hypothetical protein